MVSRNLSIVLLILSAMTFAVAGHCAEPIASIDRGVISIEDTLTLTIRLSDTGSFGSPDTSPLEQDFHVLGTSQSSRHSIINGRSESSTEWIITLAPKRPGTLTIPAMTVGNQKTGALSVTVNPARAHNATTGDEPIFMESEISAKQIYVQQQLLLTVRVFQSVQLDNMSLSDIEIENALVEKLDQTSFQRRINGRIYRVHELRYAIFPQRAGTLTIPEVVFSANEIVSQRSVFSLPGQGRPVRRLTQQYEIDVQAPPPGLSLPSGNPWLPAKDLQILESWSSNPDDLRVGDSITRTITLKARGLLGSQLPPIQFDHIAGARLYPDQGQVDNTLTEQGANSIRTDSTAIIPTREGRLELPAITIKWWDTDQQKLRTATLAAQSLQVNPAVSGAVGNEPMLAVDHSDTPSAAPTSTPSPAINSVWPLLTLLFAGLWIASTVLWLRARQHSPMAAPAPSKVMAAESEKRCFKALLAACQQGDRQQTREALIHWARSFWPQQSVHTLEQIAGLARQPSLAKQLQLLDQGLYGDAAGDTSWNGEQLAQALKLTRSHAARTHTGQQPTLPPLYAKS